MSFGPSSDWLIKVNFKTARCFNCELSEGPLLEEVGAFTHKPLNQIAFKIMGKSLLTGKVHHVLPTFGPGGQQIFINTE